MRGNPCCSQKKSPELFRICPLCASSISAPFPPRNRILADLETVEPGAPNLDQRKSRVHYYLTAGFRKTDIAYRWQDEDYVIYVHGGDITLPEFQEYWDHFS